MNIVPMRQEHVAEVARLHCAALTGLLTRLGPTAVRAFYAGCVGAPGAVALVALDDVSVRGFVLGATAPAALRAASLRARPFSTLAGLAIGVARSPRNLGFILRSQRAVDRTLYDHDAAELIYLAVAPTGRRSGVGKALVDAFGDAMQKARVPSFELSVDEGNPDAIAFYQRHGFVQVGRYREFEIDHRRYRRTC